MNSERGKNYGGSRSKAKGKKTRETEREHLEELVFLPFVFRNPSFSPLVFLFHFSKKTAAISSSDLQPPPLYFSMQA
ncbi:hypothetical protein ES288_A11G086300v1 [Gossypium darwinii]|uniref:Uncharacterized protein n=1 Tax=Gossypium darwinii TaxID=34276 RepID=A0A5D2EIY0_GOSDA|nr:hypothetical protein ES288_A11G086300v1 [Gossypium darwinii]